MTQTEYNYLQSRLDKLISKDRIRVKFQTTYSARSDGYKEGVLACKSVLREAFKHSQEDA